MPGTFTLNLSTLSGTNFVGGGGNTIATLTTDADATLTLIYDYTPNGSVGSASEPTSFALLGSGLCGMASLIRIRSLDRRPRATPGSSDVGRLKARKAP
jgi:hypothetical protein